jgi:hypothetical protein
LALLVITLHQMVRKYIEEQGTKEEHQSFARFTIIDFD